MSPLSKLRGTVALWHGGGILFSDFRHKFSLTGLQSLSRLRRQLPLHKGAFFKKDPYRRDRDIRLLR